MLGDGLRMFVGTFFMHYVCTFHISRDHSTLDDLSPPLSLITDSVA